MVLIINRSRQKSGSQETTAIMTRGTLRSVRPPVPFFTFLRKGMVSFPNSADSFGLLFLLFYGQLFHKFSNQEVTFSGETNGKKFGVFFFLGNGQPKSSFMRNHQSETTPPSNWLWFFFFPFSAALMKILEPLQKEQYALLRFFQVCVSNLRKIHLRP